MIKEVREAEEAAIFHSNIKQVVLVRTFLRDEQLSEERLAESETPTAFLTIAIMMVMMVDMGVVMMLTMIYFPLMGRYWLVEIILTSTFKRHQRIFIL